MRAIVIKQAADLQALRTLLAGAAPGAGALLERVKALNPHLNLDRVEAGTVLFVPDAPELLPRKEASPMGGDAFEALSRQAQEAFAAATGRVRAAGERAAAERATVDAVLGTAAAKRQIEGDPLFRKQVAEAESSAKAEQAALQEAAKQVESLRKVLADELAAVGKLLRVGQ